MAVACHRLRSGDDTLDTSSTCDATEAQLHVSISKMQSNDNKCVIYICFCMLLSIL